ncbi:MAG: DUF5131 family protein [Victivallales bacterium]|nr:DUF5131 family protein [Victivallales bacterium]
MNVTWNPWHGCRRISEGCQHCYMFFLDKQHGQDGSRIHLSKTDTSLPLQRDRSRNFKIPTGSNVWTCITSDFFLEEADLWRIDAWDCIARRPDLLFHIITKRVDRIPQCLPLAWGDGWPNVRIYVTVENQRCANLRLPTLLRLPLRFRGICASPLLGELHLESFLPHIDSVSCDGENYEGARVCDYAWVQSLHDQCVQANVRFHFKGTGAVFRKDGRIYRLSHEVAAQQAQKAAIDFEGHETPFHPVPPPEEPLELFDWNPEQPEKCLHCLRRNHCPRHDGHCWS